jgi:hypothetical protein
MLFSARKKLAIIRKKHLEEEEKVISNDSSALKSMCW